MCESMNKKAFTLIELLIVIAIIGILAVAFGPSLFDGPAKGRDAQRIEDLRKIANFINLEYIVTGKSLPAGGCINPASVNPADLGRVINSNLADFGGAFPKDPSLVTLCSGYYYFGPISSATSPYAALLFTYVEDASSGNYDSVTSTPSYSDLLSGAASLGEEGDRYYIFIQKGT